MKKLTRNLMYIILGIFLVGFVFAGYNYESNNIDRNYKAGNKIKGEFNISFQNEKVDSLFTSNFNGEINLLDFLIGNGLTRGDDYTCTTVNCDNLYSASSQTSGFNINTGTKKVVGFKISGTGSQQVQINSVEFDVSSNVEANCNNQILLDILNDGDDLILNTDHDGNSCGIKHRGCYDLTNTGKTEILNDRKFCEKITLPAAPAYFLGAKVEKGSGTAVLSMYLYDDNGNQLESCELPAQNQNVEELKCLVEYSGFESKDYFACINSDNNAGYKIGWETNEPKCGTVVGGGGSGFSTLGNDFNIFAESVEYAANPGFHVDNDFYDENFFNTLNNVFDGYLSDIYGRDCGNFDCVFPISFSGLAQNFVVSNLVVNYDFGGITQTVSNFYNLDVEESLISSNELELDIEKASFIIPVSSDDGKFELYLEGDLVFDEDINIERSFTFGLIPRLVSFGENIEFLVITNENVSETTWDFGDGSALETVNGKQNNHAYTLKNNSVFDLTVTVRNQANISSNKTFSINVGNPKDLANITIELYKKRLENITSNIGNYSGWISSKLSDEIGVSDLQASLNTIEADFLQAVSEDDYKEVMLDLIDLNVPYKIGNLLYLLDLPLAYSVGSINVDYIERISNKDVSNNNNLKNSIVSWMNSRFNSRYGVEHISAFYDYENEVVLSKFIIDTMPFSSLSEDTYLILGQNVETSGSFMKNYNQKSISGSGINYIVLNTGKNEKIEFYLEGEIKAENLGVYISPEIDELPLIPSIIGECKLDGICGNDENADSCPEDCSNRALKFTIWGWIILIIIALVMYVILQEWYKRKYQNKLFPKETDLYNLINFIYNARTNGLNDSQINNKLRNSGWNSEKIRFALRKIDGRRTGMFEIPIFGFFEKKKVKNEIEMRQKRPVNPMFLRRRRF